MTIPTSFLDQLRDRTLLSALIQKTVPLKKKGKEWSACCPFHNEKSPSFTVNDEKGFYHCFGCGAHGDAIRWMTDHNGMQFIDAVKELALAAGMEVPASDPQAAAREKRRNGYLDIMDRAQSRFSGALPNDGAAAAREYLDKRGITPVAAAKFGMGYAPKVPFGSTPFMAEVDGNPKALADLGLVKRNPDDGRIFDFFRDRLMIPIHDARGRCIGFGARILGQGEPKYLNSPDTPVFDKGRSLFNLHRASPAARAKNRLIIVEGYMDVIGMDSAGFEECVAPNGTALTEAQMHLAWKLVDQPIVCLDGDKAGKAAALRAAIRSLPILTPGKGLRFSTPAEGMDPDDVARKGGAAAVSEMLSNYCDIIDVLWTEACARMRDAGPDQKAGVRREMRQLVDTIKDRDVHEAYRQEFQHRFNAYNQRQQNVRQHRQAPARTAVNTAVDDAIFKGVIRHIDRLHEIAEDLSVRSWTRPEIPEILGALIFSDEDLNPATMVAALEHRGLGEAYRVQMSHETLRFPFLTGGAPSETTFRSLVEAIRAKAPN